ncbi:class I SAM-dependent methyltransferase [Candidatus Nitrosotalea bavarica]|uniref:class I SAM-dependent methyltransferase n=1 Tax=Candidatus Nitrosotalea bavarica TaxID=1903277 RepID=UPI000C6FEEB8|nr:class I SAM-dependent methyltransferase [Candidatus Nitrosotalea bavarica]
MNNPNPFDVILWTLRRSEGDVVNLYNYLSELMQISTGGNFLNFGYWNETTKNPVDAQSNLCDIVGNMAQLTDAKNMLDVGSGFSEPALLWKKNYPDIDITCLNINSNQLKSASKILDEKGCKINLLNSTATKIPMANESCDRIIVLESAQHFKPIHEFISEAKRVLKKGGFVILAIPVLLKSTKMDILKIGILKFTWSSEHYDLETVKKTINDAGLNIIEIQLIGSKVYSPLADYYIKNHEFLRSKILKIYPFYVEKILFKSMLKMKEAARDQTIEYALVKCTK